jgi:hypothetical protein
LQSSHVRNTEIREWSKTLGGNSESVVFLSAQRLPENYTNSRIPRNKKKEESIINRILGKRNGNFQRTSRLSLTPDTVVLKVVLVFIPVHRLTDDRVSYSIPGSSSLLVSKIDLKPQMESNDEATYAFHADSIPGS